MENLNIDIEKAIELLLSELYFSKNVVIDGCRQNPDGINFYTWLQKKGLITKEKAEEINSTIKEDWED